MMRKSLVLVTLTFVGVLSASIARGEVWSSPVDISSSVSPSKHPSIAKGPGGDIHVVWEGFASANWEILYSGKPTGGVWASPVNISNTGGASNRPAIAVGEEGSVHVAWHDEAAGDWDILYSSRSPDGSWLPAANVSNNVGWSFHPEIAVARDGSLHVVWHENTSGSWQILYATKPVDGPWSLPTPVWSSSEGSWFASLAVGREGFLHVAWEERAPGNWEILYSARPPGGSWLPPENVSRTDGNSRLSALTMARDGSAHVVWQDETGGSLRLHYATRGQAGSWSSAADISANILRSSRPAIAVAKDGTLYAAWVGDGSGSGEIFYAGKPPDGSWTPAVNISSNDGDSAEPALAVGEDGSRHVVWHDNTPRSNHIFYASLSTVPAATPPPATARTLPKSGAGGSGDGVSRGLLTLALAGAGAVVLAGGLLVVARRRRGSQ